MRATGTYFGRDVRTDDLLRTGPHRSAARLGWAAAVACMLAAGVVGWVTETSEILFAGLVVGCGVGFGVEVLASRVTWRRRYEPPAPMSMLPTSPGIRGLLEAVARPSPALAFQTGARPVAQARVRTPAVQAKPVRRALPVRPVAVPATVRPVALPSPASNALVRSSNVVVVARRRVDVRF